MQGAAILINPLDMQSFISILGFEVKYVDTGDSDAYTIIFGGKKLILLNQNIKSSSRINFTLAHELGHYFIPHHMEPLYACNVKELISSADLNSREEEREADIFASELLLPNQLMANSAVDGFEDILNVARKYSTSIPATAIRMIEHSNDNVCFVCCKNMKIEWFIASSIFTEYLTLKDIIGSRISEFSLFNTCVEQKLSSLKGCVPAFTWIEGVDKDLYIDEEILYYPKYNTGYLLIKADNITDLED